MDGFVNKYLDAEKSVLLAVSGGVDSLALFEMMVAYNKIRFAVAHVDHGWRASSAEEAAVLKAYVESKGVPFYLLTLNPGELKGNLEDASRECRYAFFKELCEEKGFQGVMTAHHAEDQAETVLKRILEGANLQNLGGILPKRNINGVNVFRPLLSFTKEQLREIAKNPIEDPTNLDPAFLRARMRMTIIPSLEKQFGKNVSSNLLRFADNMKKVNEYLDYQTKKYQGNAISGPMGHYLDLQNENLHHLELEHVIKKYLSSHHINLNRDQLQTITKLLSASTANKLIQTQEQTLYVDRGILFLPSVPKKTWQYWKPSISQITNCSWRDCWQGTISVSLPRGEYSVGKAEPGASYKGKSTLSKWWSKHKVPQFLKEFVPVIWQGDTVVHEFLSGKSHNTGNHIISLSLEQPLVEDTGC